MPTNRCVICSVGFKKWQEYNDHMAQHAKAASPMSPLKTTDETKEQIVARVESTRLWPFLLGHEVDRIKARAIAPAKTVEKVEIITGFDQFAEEAMNDTAWVG